MIAVDDRVTYAKTRETQHVQPDRRCAIGRVVETDTIDGYPCAQVEWPWGTRSWVRANMLELVPSTPPTVAPA